MRLLSALLFAQLSYGAVASVTHVAAASTGGAAVTTGAVTTTGATLLVACIIGDGAGPSTLTDSKSNTWTALTTYTGSGTHLNAWYVVAPTVGAGHTFTSGLADASAISVVAYSGTRTTSPLQVQSGHSSATYSTTSGSVTPNAIGDLVVSCAGAADTHTFSLSGWTIRDQQNFLAGNHYALALADFISTDGAAVNPTWGDNDSIGGAINVFTFKQPTGIQELVHTSAVSIGCATPTTTSGIDTTGATLLVLATIADGAGPSTVTDSKSNTWATLTARTGSGTHLNWFYAANPTVGSSHTFTNSDGVCAAIFIKAFSGISTTLPLHAQTGKDSITFQQSTGSITPNTSGDLIITAIAVADTHTFSIDSSFSTPESQNFLTGNHYGGAMSYLVSSDGAAVNPTWGDNSGVGGELAIATFKQTSISTPGLRTRLALLGVGGGVGVTPPSLQWSIGYCGYDCPLSSHIDWGALTHISLAWATIKSNCAVNMTDQDMATIAPALITAAHAAGVKVLISHYAFDGGSGVNWASCTTPGNLATLVANIVSNVNTYSFDGVDIDWEPFSSGTNGTKMTNLLSSLRASLPSPKVITVAAIVDEHAWWGSVASIQTNVDRVNIMTYDLWTGEPYSQHNSALYDLSSAPSSWSIQLAVTRFRNGGMAAGKLGIGIPFYGQQWTGGTGPNVNGPRITWTTSTPTLGQIHYTGIRPQITNPGNYRFDSDAGVPYLTANTQAASWLSYENEISIAAKIAWVKSNLLGGWIIWNLKMDYFPAETPKNPLLNAVKLAR